MAILNLNLLKFLYKKSRSFLLLLFFLLVTCCKADLPSYGRVSLYNNVDKNSFVFSVSDEFLLSSTKSPQDKKFPKMTEAESKLLFGLLQQKKYCLTKNGSPLFTITSRQEKIYDMTYAHLIEKNYKTRPIAPRMYFGQCEKE